MSSQDQSHQGCTTPERALGQIPSTSVAIYPPPPIYIRDSVRFVEPETLPTYDSISPCALPVYFKHEVKRLRSPLNFPNDTVGIDELLRPVAPYEWMVSVRRSLFEMEVADTVPSTGPSAKSIFLWIIFILFALVSIGAIIFGLSRIPHGNT